MTRCMRSVYFCVALLSACSELAQLAQNYNGILAFQQPSKKVHASCADLGEHALCKVHCQDVLDSSLLHVGDETASAATHIHHP